MEWSSYASMLLLLLLLLYKQASQCDGIEVSVTGQFPLCIQSVPFSISCNTSGVYAAVLAVTDAGGADVIKCDPSQPDTQQPAVDAAFVNVTANVSGCYAAGRSNTGAMVTFTVVNVTFPMANLGNVIAGNYSCRMGYTNYTGTWSILSNPWHLGLCAPTVSTTVGILGSAASGTTLPLNSLAPTVSTTTNNALNSSKFTYNGCYTQTSPFPFQMFAAIAVSVFVMSPKL